MIIITGGAGFIGSNLLKALNKMKIYDILIVDNIQETIKWNNLIGCRFSEYVNKDNFWEWVEINNNAKIDYVYHFGACSDTTEKNFDYLYENNVNFSKKIFNYCYEKNASLVYASSAATYGSGDFGYRDNHSTTLKLKPINQYGFSKHLFDLWAIKQNKTPLNWYGLKFFNVYGPKESHKGKMSSVAYHGYNQIIEKGNLKLFKSHREDYLDGQQKRDFVYVKDVVKASILISKNNEIKNGLLNIGTGKERSFADLGKALFNSLGFKINIKYVPMPSNLRSKYQYYTKANNSNLIKSGLGNIFRSLEDGIKDYVTFLDSNKT